MAPRQKTDRWWVKRPGRTADYVEKRSMETGPKVKLTAKPRYWVGDAPEKCDLCDKPIKEAFVDGAMRRQSSWANMCLPCHRLHGAGLGTGLGQRYESTADGRFVKTGG